MDNNKIEEVVNNNSFTDDIKNVITDAMKHPIKTAIILTAVSKAIERIIHGKKR